MTDHMPKLDHDNVFPAILDGIEILQVPNETRPKSSLINVLQAKVL